MDDQKARAGVISRRGFVGGLAAAAGVMIVPRRVLGGSGYQAPSDTLNIATIGYAHGMGTSNTNACGKENANIVALCDVDESQAAQRRLERSKILERFPNAARYRDFRVMLEKQKDIDGVIVATPDHTHAVVAMAAMQLGKHVYVQKPLTRTVSEARALTEAARRYKVIAQMGNQGHSGEGVRLITEWIADGAIGKVREVHCWTNRPVWAQGMETPTVGQVTPEGLDWDLFLGPAQQRPYHEAYHPFSWRAWVDYGAGALGDMACHVMDAAYTALKLGYPTSVQTHVAYITTPVVRPDGSVGNRRMEYKDSFPPAEIVHYTFPARSADYPEVKLHWYDGGLMPERPEELEPERRLPESGTIFVGEKGKLMSETYSESPRLIPESFMQSYKRPERTIPRIEGSHEKNWLDAIKGVTKNTSHFDYAGPFTETVLLGNLGVLFPGQKLMWDGPNMKVTNVAEANEFVQHHYRQGWTL
ncbi:MAG TPA: Gfo/Idh/MocA family oxidoreductase [Vicinamibacterales bacterium]|nr:Gfo/Idh/MocA family oxidoreductase [Vicinamibacterales bacterium]